MRNNSFFRLGELFSLLKKSLKTPVLSTKERVQWSLEFYGNNKLDTSIKCALNDVITSCHFTFDDNVKRFISKCLHAVHDDVETSSIFSIFYDMCRKSEEVTKFLNNTRIVGRIFDITIPKLILTL